MKLVLTLLCPQVQEGSAFSPSGPGYPDPCIAAVICLQIINVRRMGGLMREREKGRGEEGRRAGAGRGRDRRKEVATPEFSLNQMSLVLGLEHQPDLLWCVNSLLLAAPPCQLT